MPSLEYLLTSSAGSVVVRRLRYVLYGVRWGIQKMDAITLQRSGIFIL